MVQCDDCDRWCHFTCVGVTEEVKELSWVCLKCQSAQKAKSASSSSRRRDQQKTSENAVLNPQSGGAKTSNIPALVIHTATDAHSSQSGGRSRSSKSSQSLLKLQLMRLEEERAFEEAEAAKFREYLKEKYRLLEQMSNRSESSCSIAESRVGKWVDNVNDAFQDEREPGGSNGSVQPQRTFHYPSSC
nr:transcription factor bye1-like [Aedes albopictus]